jgi:hypothetical protein
MLRGIVGAGGCHEDQAPEGPQQPIDFPVRYLVLRQRKQAVDAGAEGTAPT